MYKVKFLKLIAANIVDLFSVLLSSYNLRNSDLSIPRVNTVKYGRHLRYLGPFLWSKFSKKDRDHIIGFQTKYSEERPFKSHS